MSDALAPIFRTVEISPLDAQSNEPEPSSTSYRRGLIGLLFMA